MCKVSIIIPCYNVEAKLLHRCLTSIDSQTFSDYEIIVINDGSDSDYSERFHEIDNKYKNISVYHQENKGVSAARNFGLEKSQGKYTVFVDADDYLASSFLAESVAIAEKNNADIVMGMNVTTYAVDDEEIKISGSKKVSVFGDTEIKSINKWMLGRVQHQEDGSYLGQGPWNRLVKRQLAVSTPFNEALPIGEDIVWNLQLLQKARKVCIAHRVWYRYYMNPCSSSRKYRENAIKESYDSLMEMKKYLDLNDDEQYLSYCLRCWSDLNRIYRCYLSHNRNGYSQQKKYLFQNYPWHELATKRFKNLCDLKYRFMRGLYINQLLFGYYRIKSIFSNKKE